MNRALTTSPRPRAARPGILDSFARRLVLDRLQALTDGELTLCDGAGQHRFGTPGGALAATVTVLDPGFYGAVAFGGSIGAGEAFMRGDWECDDLVTLVRLLLRNRDVLDGMERGPAALVRPLRRALNWLNRNTRRGARRNIAAHYDLGNEFFALWLDESMMYSCAVFERPDMSLAEAQRARLDRVCRRLDLRPGDHLLEIGTGWGGLALHAAGNYGCRVTTTTISRRQYEFARERIAQAGLADRVTLRLDDYRDLDGRYDKLVSLEMIEAIGAAQYETYFSRCAALLKPGGRLLIQAITIEDERFDEYRRNVDFIQRYIFPGSCLPSVSAMREAIASAGDLAVTGIDEIGPHYATTLAHWRRNFHRNLDSVRALGYSEEFIRMWEFYFCYCEGGFREGSIGDVHLVAERPLAS